MSSKENNIKILDCTLRDGSYAINFQFTARDTMNICRGLERSGIDLIEVGHGLGIGASSPKNGIAFESDLEYISSARSVVSSAKIGAFYIPGIGSIDQLNDARNAGLNFIRIGVNVNDILSAINHIEAALSYDIDVHLNLMKSYALYPDELLEALSPLEQLGLSSVYIVDSAGCMLPRQVSKYISALNDNGWAAGFHGHNNLDLANANCLAALEAGAKYVDSSLCGMGRSAGNAQTEVISWLIKQEGYMINIDQFNLFDLIEETIKPLMIYPQGKSAIEIITGMSRFHSSYLPRFKKATNKYDVNIYRLIQNVSSIDCIDPSEELILSIAKDLNRTSR